LFNLFSTSSNQNNSNVRKGSRKNGKCKNDWNTLGIVSVREIDLQHVSLIYKGLRKIQKEFKSIQVQLKWSISSNSREMPCKAKPIKDQNFDCSFQTGPMDNVSTNGLIRLDDSIDDLFITTDESSSSTTTTNERENISPLKQKHQQAQNSAVSKIQNEEQVKIDDMPASPPFTKVSSIKIYKTPSRKDEPKVIKVTSSSLTKTTTKSFLPVRVKRKREE
jgi:hypothetical protein